jgi:PAS domain S-box-containing protein
MALDVVAAPADTADTADTADKERLARAVAQVSHDALAIVDRNGRITEANGRMAGLTGRGRDTLVGSRLNECFADPDLAADVVRRAFAGATVVDAELTLREEAGGSTLVSCTAVSLPDGSTSPARVLLAARVLADPRGGEEQGVFAALVQSSHDAIVGKTIDGLITSWNPSAERLYGFAASEVIGRPFVMVVPPNGWAAEAEIRQLVAAGERVEPYEADRLGSDGTAFTVSVAMSPIRDADGRIVGVASTTRDLSERTLAETKVRWMLEVAPDAILGLDAAGFIELVNLQCERLLGYGRDELMGQPVETLIPDGIRPVQAGEIGAGFERTALHKDGTAIPVEISLSAMETSGGRLSMAALRDITDRRRVERQLHEQNVELERASRAKNNFLASMSHELRTPLNAIIGFTGTMLMRLPGPLNDDQEHQLRLVQMSGKHLLSIINDLLDLAKIESGRVQITLEPVDCRRVAVEVLQSLQPLAEGKAITLVADVPDGPVMATSDRRALGQILINLVNNAIKFTDVGGVRVSLLPADGREGRVRITVRDTGPGIPAGDQERIFRAFERSAITAKSAEEGTGLGLHISQRLAELVGATVTLSSVVGEGSTFTISLSGE